jgi:tryptophan halogenase
MYHNVKSITIVGGGSSGWMTAAAIAKKLPHIKLTLIESPNVPIIGVGESTIGHINQYFDLLDLKDEDWMPHCNATYKTSIKFIDFRETPTETPHTFHYPFGIFDVTDKPRGVMEWFLYKTMHPELDSKNFAEFYHDAILMTDATKMTKNEDHRIRGFNFNADTAYHMDATAFGIYLRDYICLPSGMTHLRDDIIVDDIVMREDGSIEKIATKNSGYLEADLFIDCTGFKSLLLEQTLGTEFISFHDTLLNDSAIATVIPYIDADKEMENYTSCTAIEAGWVWNIPLYSRIGTGYVYSSKYATQEEAEAQFRKHLKSNRMLFPDTERADAAELRHIKIKHGVHERAWNKNVVGIGLANGFIEPLESTGLMLTHEAIIKLVATLTMRKGHVTNYEVDLFNNAFQDQIMGFKDFISHHYALSRRNDTPYWQKITGDIEFARTTSNYTALSGYHNNQAFAQSDFGHRMHRSRTFDSVMGGIIYIAAGMDYNPMDQDIKKYLDKKFMEPEGYSEVVYNKWLAHREEVMAYIDTLPTHREFLAQNIHK